MKNIILIFLTILFISCSKQGDNSDWSFTKIFTTEKTIEDVTINDKKFIFETADGKEIECFLNYSKYSENKSIDDKTLRYIIKESNRFIKADLLLPSSFTPLEYSITQIDDYYGREVIKIQVSGEAKNRDRKIELYPWKLEYDLKGKEFNFINF